MWTAAPQCAASFGSARFAVLYSIYAPAFFFGDGGSGRIGAWDGDCILSAGKSFCDRPTRLLRWDQPRIRGENAFLSPFVQHFQGSPPPMRGKETARKIGCRLYGITPAHAGKSVVIYYDRRAAEDHPRPCGEKPAGRSPSDACGGSPPPMRGKGKCLTCHMRQ